jgi:hypothetical protein
VGGYCQIEECYFPAHGASPWCRGHLRRVARGREVGGPLRETLSPWSSLVEAAIGLAEAPDCDDEYRARALALRRAARAYASGTDGPDP